MGGFAEHLHDGLPALHEHSKTAASFVRDVTVSLAAELAAAHAAFGRDVLRLVARKRTLVEKVGGWCGGEEGSEGGQGRSYEYKCALTLDDDDDDDDAG